MKLYCKNLVIKYKKDYMKIIFNKDDEINIHHDNMEYVLVDIEDNEISLKGNYITVLYNKNCCDEINFNTNKKLPLSSIRKKYKEYKKKYKFFGKLVETIKEGHFELAKSNNRTIKSNVFTVVNLSYTHHITEEAYLLLDRLITRYNETEFDGTEVWKWFEYDYKELRVDMKNSEYNDIIHELVKNELIENDNNYWRLV